MKLIQFNILVIVMLLSFSCKAQQVNSVMQTNNYSTDIIGVWVDSDDPNYKLEFLNGTCKVNQGDQLISTYNYSIENNNCENYSASNTIYLKWVNLAAQQNSCFEIANMTENTLSLMIIDNAKILFFNKQ